MPVPLIARRATILLLATLCARVTTAGPVGRPDMSTLRTPIYKVEDGTFTATNTHRYLNRPLYASHLSAALIAGDMPYVLLGGDKRTAGCLMFALSRDGQTTWLQNAATIASRYRPGQMEWTISDPAWSDTHIELTAVPAAEGTAGAVRLQIINPHPDDQLLYASGGALAESAGFLAHADVTTAGRDAQLNRGFTATDCKNNIVEVSPGQWAIRMAGKDADPGTLGQCSAPATVALADASAWPDLQPATNPRLPLALGSLKVGSDPIFFSLAQGDDLKSAAPAEAFTAGLARAQSLRDRVVIHTPDPRLDAAVASSSVVTDAVFRGGVYTHAGMRWGVPLLGWRTMFGGTVYGWHDNVLAQARSALAKQLTTSDRTTPRADPKRGLASEAPDSMFFGKGRVDFHQPDHYDMQTQFFDQLIHACRWTGNAELEKLLRPALDLHLDYVERCFGRDGTYESYANTWPTDDQWYNGGGTSEETAYVFAAHRAAALLAERAGDKQSAAAHAAKADEIRAAFMRDLWVGDRGHPGAYREQGGLKRLHESAWLYATFIPIDAGLLGDADAAQALHYTEWALERMPMPYGGEQCWPSNWVPSVWSVREMWPGDNYHLALAYFQTGLADEGWKLLSGTFPQYLQYGPVPGDLGHPAGATDFNDCASMFCRTVVEGLFGYRPNYPEDLVYVVPALPHAWDNAYVRTPDFSMSFARTGNVETYDVSLAKPSDTLFVLPAPADRVEAVTLDGQPVQFDPISRLGQPAIKLLAPNFAHGKVELRLAGPHAPSAPTQVAAEIGTDLSLAAPAGVITRVLDPQNTIADAKVVDGKIVGRWRGSEGDHLVLAEVQRGSLTYRHEFKVHLTDTSADNVRASKTLPSPPANATWFPVDATPALNADVRTIFQQKYLTPRPNTCSLRIAADGYATWQMILEKKYKPPTITLDNVPALLKDDRLTTQDGIPFARSRGDKNIAFTSQWDNWPKSISLPVHQSGQAAYFLLCGSTNPMQVQIPNARLHLKYADNTEDTLDLIPPFNFWSLCKFGNADYDYKKDFFSLPKIPPPQIQLGENCRAIILNARLKPNIQLDHVELECLSQEVVIGLMGVTILNPTAK